MKALVLGASGGFGGAMARTLAGAGWQVARYRRGTDMAAAAEGADVIVNGLNPPNYHDWARTIPAITAEVLAAAAASGARVLVPGNVYPFGNQPGPWGTDTPHRPNTRKGRIRAEMEATYRAAAAAGKARVLILRGGDFLDPDAPHLVMGRVILPAVAKGRITTLGDPTARRAHAYLPDMARAAVMLLARDSERAAFADVPFAGHSFSINDLASEITAQTGRTMRITNFPWWAMRLASPVWELARELREMRYLFDLPHSLDPAPLARLCPDFRPTPFAEVVAAHLRASGLVPEGKVNPDGAMARGHG